MLILGPTFTTILASMHWTLVEFASSVIATSDHPVVLWPLSVRSRAPQPTRIGVGVLECSEIRLPLSSRHVVLMTWADKRDHDDVRVPGSRYHASNFNAFTIAQADRQWFHLPDMTPPIGSG